MSIKPSDISPQQLHTWIQGCKTGDRAAQRALYERYAPQMMALCLRYARNTQEAEEILQDGFLQMYRNIGQYKFIGSFGSWLRKIMINCALMRYRGRTSNARVLPLAPEYEAATPSQDFLDRLGVQELIRLIQALPPSYRMVFNLYVFEGLKHREIAALLGISEGTSKSNLSDARTLLRQALPDNLKAVK